MERHLVVVDKAFEHSIRRELKRNRRSHVDIISVDELDEVCISVDVKREEIQGVDTGFKAWDTINLILDGNCDEETRKVSFMGVKLRVDVHDECRFAKGERYETFKTVMTHLSNLIVQTDQPSIAHRGIYIYASGLGKVPGFLQLLKPFVKPQVYVSTNAIGNGDNEDWQVEWGTSDWYVLTSDQRKHARRHLFHDLDEISLTDAADECCN